MSPPFDEKPSKHSNEMPAPDDASSTITVVDVYEPGSIDPVYQAKAHLLSCAVQEIGMGKYQVCCTPIYHKSIMLMSLCSGFYLL